MKRSRFSEAPVIAILREREAGAKTADVCRECGISSATFHAGRRRTAGSRSATRGGRGPLRRRTPS